LAALAVCLSLVAAGCTGGVTSGNRALSAAQAAGQPTNATVGEPLDDALVQQAARHPRLCIADYTRALKSFPNLPSAYSGRAACYLSGAINAAAALHDDSRALALAPPTAGGYLNRARAYRATGNITAALQDFGRAVAVPSASAGEVLSAVDATLAVGTVAQARALLAGAETRLAGSATIQVAAADVAVAGDDGTAAQHFAQAQTLARPDSGEEALVLAHVCHWQLLRGDLAGAADSCSSSVVLSSSGSGAYDDLSAARAGLGQLDGAIAAVTAAIGALQGSVGPFAQSAGVDGFGLAGLLEQRGRLEVERHQTDLAVADYQRARASLPGSSPDFLARLKGDINSARLD
jgi:tetratricopeptide (TPR) repeat protein